MNNMMNFIRYNKSELYFIEFLLNLFIDLDLLKNNVKFICIITLHSESENNTSYE